MPQEPHVTLIAHRALQGRLIAYFLPSWNQASRLIMMNYIAPLLIGFCVAAIYAQNLNPISRPNELSARPQWIFGLWLGVSATIAAGFALNSITHLTLNNMAALGLPTFILFAAMAAPGLAIFLFYRSKIEQSLEETILWDEENNSVIFHGPDGETLNNQGFTKEVEDNSVADTHNIQVQNQVEIVQNAPQEALFDQCVYDEAFDQAYANSKTPEKNPVSLKPLKDDLELNFLHQARRLARQEYDQRCRAETNLRITRAALAKLESKEREEQEEQTEAQLESEQALSAKAREISVLESKLIREQEHRAKAEDQLLESKDLVLQAKADVRKNMEARSKALLTARKTMLLARRSVAARTRTQNELHIIREQLEKQTEATASLIEALETEKAVNRKLTEKQSSSKSAVEQRRKLSADLLKNKLVKKVAKPRSMHDNATKKSFQTLTSTIAHKGD